MTDDKIIARVFYPVDRLIIVSRIRHFRAIAHLYQFGQHLFYRSRCPVAFSGASPPTV